MGQQTVDVLSAIQYLIWAIEEIDKIGHPIAARHARNALAELRRTQREAEAVLIVIKDSQCPQRS